MKSAEGNIGRIFMIRLEDGDIIPDCLEDFASKNNIKTGMVTLIGGMGKGNIVTGPRDGKQVPPEPIITPLEGVHEVLASGIIAPDGSGKPVLHIHGALGRDGRMLGGCLRPGLSTWLVGEVIVTEILGLSSKRLPDAKSGFSLLEP
ncbi:MAG: DNA-binding protein [Bacillota bacterium]|nr:DNA-binding protein [Bacillota bacterium]